MAVFSPFFIATNAPDPFHISKKSFPFFTNNMVA